MNKCRLYQIYYDAESRSRLGQGFIPLDNSDNSRPDWREYWPIRKYLLQQPLDDNLYYGFLSPKFSDKTSLDFAQVRDFIAGATDDIDVVIVSSYWDYMAHFWNVVEHGELSHPGFTGICREFFEKICGYSDVAGTPNTSRNTIYGNYFAARPRFWRRWLVVCEQLFVLCEKSNTPLAMALNENAKYDLPVQFKVFLMERAASIILANEKSWRSVTYNPFKLKPSTFQISRFGYQAIINDALKIAYVDNGYDEYKNAFAQMRESIKYAITGVRNAELADAFLRR